MADEATKTEEETQEETEEETEEEAEEEKEEEEAEEEAADETDEDSGPPEVDLSDEAEDVVESFEDLDDDQRREAFLKIVGEAPVLWISDVVSAMEDRFGVSTAAPAVAAAPAGGAGGGDEEEEEEKAIVDVVLKDFGDEKIQVIKAVRGQTELGLKEAKQLVDEAPNTIKEGVPKEEAESIKEEIEEAGGTVELE